MIRCLFLVEGPYDKQRLSLLEELFDSNKIEILPFGCDMLTEQDYYKNFEKEIRTFLSKEKTYVFEDFDYIIQVCDLDGCFIDDNYIIENKNISKIQYHQNSIEAISKEDIENRNRIKRENIDNLLTSQRIHLYYNSTNIDHVFDNIQNPTRKQKNNFAINMYKKYTGYPIDFLIELFNSNRIMAKDYNSSWDEIKKDFNSLKSCTNLIFFVERFKDYLKEEVLIEYLKLKNM